MAPSAIAACAVRGNSIYIYYQSNKNPSSYPLSVLSAQPSSQSSGSNAGSPTATPGPINPYFPSSLSQTNTYGQYDDATTTVSKSNDNKKILATDSDIAPAAPSNGVKGVNGTLYVQLLSIINSGSNLASLGSQASSLSMVSMNTYRHDLLLAFNGRGGSMMSGSALVRMIPQSPSTGNGLDSLSGLPWTFETIQPPLLAYGATTQLWLATPRGSTADQASLVYDMFTSQNKAGLQLGMLDIDGGRVSVLGNVIPIQSDGNPVLVHLESSTSLLNYNMAIIGVSSTAPTLSTGIYFSSDDGTLVVNLTDC
ncbi:hypothetical protein BGZ97_009127 [Linnemannia gamsii]|uniref:Uncharacterized protein n=1 Tax=Linnemannia gamsii TaxID=64522 RepID=A0A9P6RAL8_9FUNG|nr:hypothetical protein BGZ97_009127 [Linnemannia gamsii]